ncbi:unnamed protein product [Cyprideis torosa]|uniref:Uncharacterized protein n=1 Tax=Cyprideis torosa TaxID=163714 RepID=A0A7R8W479_9CRUS|nr:unnamed protein product [Cyprideis torosa]CAG0879320.1 unnamed protein product [Cyprideis torosa]
MICRFGVYNALYPISSQELLHPTMDGTKASTLSPGGELHGSSDEKGRETDDDDGGELRGESSFSFLSLVLLRRLVGSPRSEERESGGCIALAPSADDYTL